MAVLILVVITADVEVAGLEWSLVLGVFQANYGHDFAECITMVPMMAVSYYQTATGRHAGSLCDLFSVIHLLCPAAFHNVRGLGIFEKTMVSKLIFFICFFRLLSWSFPWLTIKISASRSYCILSLVHS